MTFSFIEAHKDYQTRAEAGASIFEYIEAFYNPKRRHSSVGYLSPAEYEKASRVRGPESCPPLPPG